MYRQRKALTTSPSERPKMALLDADIICYRTGFASEDVDEKLCLARVTELVTDIVYFQLKCDDYKAYITEISVSIS
jgi:hypothetical protein